MKNNKAVRFTNFSSLLTSNVTYDYGNVGIDSLRSEVVKNAVRFFGQKGYKVLKKEFQTAVTNRRLLGIPTRFADYQKWMFEVEVWGFAQLIPLAIEFGLDQYIEDWGKHLDEWLDLYPTPQATA